LTAIKGVAAIHWQLGIHTLESFYGDRMVGDGFDTIEEKECSPKCSQ